ncbi:hypothetical protein BMS3Abin08_00576 [bacterium BMS3Abin08]|nr:hypothetical protein BMS3Abin08_00576 [bacterium BMS3Abin08]
MHLHNLIKSHTLLLSVRISVEPIPNMLFSQYKKHAKYKMYILKAVNSRHRKSVTHT